MDKLIHFKGKINSGIQPKSIEQNKLFYSEDEGGDTPKSDASSDKTNNKNDFTSKTSINMSKVSGY